jgi:putative endonuclease
MARAWVYILASQRHGTLYVGVTSNLPRRMWEHREGLGDGFTKRYAVKHLVYAEPHDEIAAAIQRETSLKRWRRAWKIALIEASNPGRVDLYDSLA